MTWRQIEEKSKFGGINGLCEWVLLKYKKKQKLL